MMKNLRISFIIPFLFGFLNAQTSVQGTVSDQNGDPLAGANVVVSGTSVGAASDADPAISRRDIGRCRPGNDLAADG